MSESAWEKNTIEIAPPRGLAFYERLTGINREDLRGKRYLIWAPTKKLF